MKYSISTFGGMLPRIEPRLLKEVNAQQATSTKLRSGALVPFHGSSIVKKISAPVSTYTTLYQYAHTSEDIFLYFEEDVDIVKGPIANDAYNRSYITGLDKPRVFDTTTVSNTDTLLDSSNTFELAIPYGNGGNLTTDGAGSGDLISTAYVYTYLRTWADGKFDEGQPSDPATNGSGDVYIDKKIGDTITISGIEDCPNQALNGVTDIAIYRVATGTTDATYQLVTEFNIADAKLGSVGNVTWYPGTETFSYADSLDDEDLGDGLVSTTWDAPDDGLSGLISLKNGCLVAFKDNVIHISEPYQLHAWPTDYQVVVDYDIVGLGAFGNTIVVLTERYPILINAQDPTVTITQPTHSTAPCSSKRGIVNYENTVYYPTVDGLIAISSAGLNNVTQAYMTKEEWQEYFPSSFEAAIQDGRYFAFYSDADTNTSGFLIVDLEEATAAVSTDTFSAASFYVDKNTDTLYFIQNNPTAGWLISQWEGLDSNRVLIWKSKVFLSDRGPMNLSAARVRAEFLSDEELAVLNEQLAAAAEAQKEGLKGEINALPFNSVTFNGDIYQSFSSLYALQPQILVKFYVDGELIHTATINTDKPFRLPVGITGTRFEVQVESNMPVYQIEMATSMRELQ